MLYGIHADPQNNIVSFTDMGDGRDRILYPQYLSGVVLGIQEEDWPRPENTSTLVLYYCVLSELLSIDEPDS
jgi:hypothetical protein